MSNPVCQAAVVEIYPAQATGDEEFERRANALAPGDELILHDGIYSQTGRRAVTVQGTAERPIVIRAAQGATPVLTRPDEQRDSYNNIEFVDCAFLILGGIHFKGGSSGVRFIRGHHVTMEACDVGHTGNNAITMNSGDCDHFLIRRNHIHHTGLSTAGPTEGEGLYIGCHDGSCVTTNSLVEGNHIHHLRGTSVGGSDGVEIKFGSHGNIVRDNVIHNTTLGRPYPGILVYGGGATVNIVEGNVIWRAGEGIQVVSDAVVRNNIIFDCTITGITAAPHAAVPRMQNVTIVNNTLVGHPVGMRLRWAGARDMLLANNAIYCPRGVALDAAGLAAARISRNAVAGSLRGVQLNDTHFYNGGDIAAALADPAQWNFWPLATGPLARQADPALTPERDFNGTARTPPGDVGAYAIEGNATNPGWAIHPGFKEIGALSPR